jgi:hypothetical protein
MVDTARHLRYTSRAKREADVSLSRGCTGTCTIDPWSFDSSGVPHPTFIDVENDGKRFAEMHVDGSVISNVPAVPEALLLAKLPRRTTARPRLYIIVNGKLAPDFDLVADGTLSIVAVRSSPRSKRTPATP